ncbi:chromate resistance protein ChrB domain-containing protein [Azospirillum sp. TSO22-1]|uniref:chromate resistance protein ChrB domain-containing protein n=1 Tax=Azospirillum sp. TSO22-1 TaxID=716789 RepID=UPI000D61C847|nr:chromate resistance protein ChrB domain-containing protein [Azospirillum sp. TSO22-1]PWC54180.1 hypothetical protein TSO221_09040 [Azospirillum sp. TSO22-1]
MATPIDAITLAALIEDGRNPLLLDVRREPAYAQAGGTLPGALRRTPEDVAAWVGDLEIGRTIVVACVHGHEVSQTVAATLVERGLDARYLEGGVEGWREVGRALAAKPAAPTRWVTRERPKIDRLACPWLIRRFVDPDARFLYVPAEAVLETAERTGATPFDVPGVHFGHHGERCSFDAFVADCGIEDPAVHAMAAIVRGADTGALGLTPQSAGLFALSRGLGMVFGDDQTLLRHGLVLYDALYRWCGTEGTA